MSVGDAWLRMERPAALLRLVSCRGRRRGPQLARRLVDAMVAAVLLDAAERDAGLSAAVVASLARHLAADTDEAGARPRR